MSSFRIAVVTPYCNESDEVLSQCHESVKNQTYPCTHILVADGHPNSLIDSWDATHLVLEKTHHNNGNTPRSHGATHALNKGFNGIAFLDADNWYMKNHITQLTRAISENNHDIATSRRKIFDLNGKFLYDDDSESVGYTFADTSCIMLANGGLPMADIWEKMPDELSPLCDRFFWNAILQKKISMVHVSQHTVGFRSRYAQHYVQNNKEPPQNLLKRQNKLKRRHRGGIPLLKNREHI